MDKLKPSQLIELGVKQPVEHIRQKVHTCHDNQVDGACAIGFMIIGRAGTLDLQSIQAVENEVIDLLSKIDSGDPHPERNTLNNLIIYWNDDRRCTIKTIIKRLKDRGL